MALVINTNIGSLNAQRQLNMAAGSMSTAMERLSSGSRINSAADDAAGLAITNRQTSQIRGLDQAVRNANDGISLIQTAEGALSETTNILQRMRELAVQSANGIYGDSDRATLDAESQQLVAELDRIASSTAFNGQNILDGTLGEVDLQVGANSNQTIGFSIDAVDADTLGMGSLSADVVGGEIAAAFTNLSDQDILINGQAVGAFTGGTLQDLVDNVNENINGVTASTVVELVASTVGTGVVAESANTTITVTKNDGNTLAINISDTENLAEFAAKVGQESGGLVSASINEDGKLTISAQDARSVVLANGSATGAGATGSAQAKIVLESESGDEITIERGATGTLADLNAYGFRESDVGGVIQGVGLVANSNGANESLAVGELTINGVEIDSDDTNSLAGKIANINDVTDQTGVTAVAYSQISLDLAGVTTSATADQLVMNGVAVNLALTAGSSSEEVVTAFNKHTDTTGVSARLLGTNLILESDQGAITLAANSTGANSFLGSAGSTTKVSSVTFDVINSSSAFSSNATAAGLSAATITALAGLKLISENGNPVSVELSGDTEAARLGVLESNTLGASSFGTAVSSISIDTQANAQKAIDVIDNALESVNDTRSELGAVNNRLDFTISNLANVSENASAARSRIMDADFAAESAALSRSQVLQQASQAMLAQANAQPQQVLSLLQ